MEACAIQRRIGKHLRLDGRDDRIEFPPLSKRKSITGRAHTPQLPPLLAASVYYDAARAINAVFRPDQRICGFAQSGGELLIISFNPDVGGATFSLRPCSMNCCRPGCSAFGNI
jgi:hypothetical protein